MLFIEATTKSSQGQHLILNNPATIQLNTYEVIINLIELYIPHLNLLLQATFSKAGAELGTAQPQLDNPCFILLNPFRRGR